MGYVDIHVDCGGLDTPWYCRIGLINLNLHAKDKGHDQLVQDRVK